MGYLRSQNQLNNFAIATLKEEAYNETMSQSAMKALTPLMVGLAICALCALFPPRRTIPRAESAPRGFLFDPKIQWVNETAGYGTTYSGAHVEIDTGRLMSECILAFSVCGFISLCFWRGHFEQPQVQS